MKSKGDFMIDLLNSKKLSANDKERILKLSAKEFESNNIETNNEIKGKIEELKKIIVDGQKTLSLKIDNLVRQDEFKLKFREIETLIAENNGTNKRTIKDDRILPRFNSNQYPIYHNPSKTVKLLNNFTDNDKSLKYTSHSWEEGKFKSYDDFMSKIAIEWEDIKNPLKEQSNRLHGKISNFLFNSSLGSKDADGHIYSWGEKRLKFGWASPALKAHMLKEDVSPFSCEIPQEIKKLDKKNELNYFKHYIEEFKNEIECREDTKNLKKIIIDLYEEELGFVDFKVLGIDNLDGFSFFTDVQYLKEALKKVFSKSFQPRKSFGEIIIDRTSNFKNGGYHLIKICQKDSFSKRHPEDGKILNPSGELFDIINSLRNLADYSIESKFGDEKYYRINFLSSTEVSFVEEIINNEPKGFTHVFKFYLNEQNSAN
jgi:hypothetical protein